MNDSLILLLSVAGLIVFSAFCSGSETGMMSVNRYRIRHLARQKHIAAVRVNYLLQRADRLLGVILIGNTLANVVSSALVTPVVLRVYGTAGVAVASLALTFVILIFAEMAPKTLAATYPEKFSYFVSAPLKFLLLVLYPFVWLATNVTNALLRLLGISLNRQNTDPLSSDELKSVVNEATGRISADRQDMLLGILDLNRVTVNHIMVPRNDIKGIDLNQDWPVILKQLTSSQHTRLPVYRDSIDSVQGVLHLRRALNLMAKEKLTKATLISVMEEAFFVPEATILSTQLVNFRCEKRRLALVVDEYGDIQGLVTIEDILEEVVGDYTTDTADASKHVIRQRDGSYLIAGSISVRELNRTLSWELPEQGPATLSGLIVETLENIPPPGTGVRIAGYPIEIIAIEDNTVKTAKLIPGLRKQQLDEEV